MHHDYPADSPEALVPLEMDEANSPLFHQHVAAPSADHPDVQTSTFAAYEGPKQIVWHLMEERGKEQFLSGIPREADERRMIGRIVESIGRQPSLEDFRLVLRISMVPGFSALREYVGSLVADTAYPHRRVAHEALAEVDPFARRNLDRAKREEMLQIMQAQTSNHPTVRECC